MPIRMGYRGGRIWIGGLLAAAVVCVTASSASAATVFGADLSQTPTNDCNACAALTLNKTSGAPQLGSPITGILTSARIRTRGNPASGNFRILHPTGTATEYRNDGEAPVSVTADITAAGHVTEVLTQLPIQSGDQLAISFPDQDTNFLSAAVAAQCAVRLEGPTQPVGTSANYTTPSCAGVGTGFEVLVSGTVEVDADHDGFGDDSQDQCPTDGSTHGPCPTTAPTTPTTPPPPHKKKCKKKKHRSAAVSAKKCKKHHH